jgi:tetratricopeptide (TPR) repeat protein
MMKANVSKLLCMLAFSAGLLFLAGPMQAQEKGKKKKKADTPPAAPAATADDPNDLKAELLKLNNFTGIDAMQTRLTELIKDKDRSKKLVKLAAEMTREAKNNDKPPPFNYNASLILAKTAHSLKDYDDAEVFYDRCATEATKLQSASETVQAFNGLIDLYQDMKKFNAVEEVCQKFLDLNFKDKESGKEKFFFLEKLIQAKAKQGQTDEALRMAEGLVQSSLPEDAKWYVLKLKGFVQHEAGKIDDAIDTYKEAINSLDKSTLEEAERTKYQDMLRYILSGLYVEADKIDPAAEQLQELVKKYPDNATYKNDLGFIWCDHNMKLPEAEKLIREAIEEDKKMRAKLKEEGKLEDDRPNAAYLDSLGWVLYKQKKYEEALKYLKEASTDPEEGQHIEIFDHVADCEAAMGNKKAALETLLKAVKLEDVSKRDAERRRKMTEKIKKLRSEVKMD